MLNLLEIFSGSLGDSQETSSLMPWIERCLPEERERELQIDRQLLYTALTKEDSPPAMETDQMDKEQAREEMQAERWARRRDAEGWGVKKGGMYTWTLDSLYPTLSTLYTLFSIPYSLYPTLSILWTLYSLDSLYSLLYTLSLLSLLSLYSTLFRLYTLYTLLSLLSLLSLSSLYSLYSGLYSGLYSTLYSTLSLYSLM